MKKQEKKGLMILIIVSILIIGVIWGVKRNNQDEKEKNEVIGNEFVQVQQDGSKVNTSEKVKEIKNIEGIRIENIRVTERNGQTMLVADITNTTENKKDRFLVDILLYDKQGNQIGKIPGVIGEMQVGETIEMQAGITGDFVNAYEFKIVKK